MWLAISEDRMGACRAGELFARRHCRSRRLAASVFPCMRNGDDTVSCWGDNQYQCARNAAATVKYPTCPLSIKLVSTAWAPGESASRVSVTSPSSASAVTKPETASAVPKQVLSAKISSPGLVVVSVGPDAVPGTFTLPPKLPLTSSGLASMPENSVRRRVMLLGAVF
jgi:hypothetical protein